MKGDVMHFEMKGEKLSKHNRYMNKWRCRN